MGSNEHGKLGIGSSHSYVPMVKSPMLISSLASHKMVDISFNEKHSVALSSNKTAFSWGYAAEGALGYKLDKEYQV